MKVLGVLLFFILIIVIMLGNASYLHVLDIIGNNTPIGTDGNTSLMLASVKTTYQQTDYLGTLLMLVGFVLVFLTGWFTPKNLWGFTAELFGYVIGILGAVVLQNIITEVMSINTIWTAYLIYYPMMQVILSNVILFYLGYGATFLISSYAKRNIFVTSN